MTTKQSQAWAAQRTTDPQGQLVPIARILKPRGLSGELKVQILTNIPNALDLAPNIEKVSYSGDFAFIRFKGVNSIEAAESMRGKLIEVPRDLLQLADDEVFADDLIGFEVIASSGKKLGTVRKVESVRASEVFDLGHMMIPNEDAFIIETNMQTKQIIANESMLEEETIR